MADKSSANSLINTSTVEIRRFARLVVEKRVHWWTAVYFIGIWNALEPMITFFGFSAGTIEIIRNLGIALFPLVLIAAWFHGEPGTQHFRLRTEGVAYIVGAALFGLAYWRLSVAPLQRYTIVFPASRQMAQWIDDNIVADFEKEHDIDIVIDTYSPESDQELLAAFTSGSDSSELLLACVPLNLTGVLMNNEASPLISFEEVARNHLQMSSDQFQRTLAPIDSTALRFARNHDRSGELFFLPAAYETFVLVYRPSKVSEAVEGWRGRAVELSKRLESVAGVQLPRDYELESDVGQWDYLDIFVSGAFWAGPSGIGHQPKLAYPCADSPASFALLMNKALAHGARLDEILSLPNRTNGPPAAGVVEAFFWDAVLREADLLYPATWLPGGTRQGDIVELIKNGKVFMTFLTSSQVASLLTIDLDIGIAPLPFGMRQPAGESNGRTGFPNVWFWGIPKSSPSYDLSVRLAQWMTRKSSQRLLARHSFQLPVRKAMLKTEALADGASRPFWSALLGQFQAHRSVDLQLNPFARMQKNDYDVLQRFYLLKWQAIIANEGYRSAGGRVERKTIRGQLMLPYLSLR